MRPICFVSLYSLLVGSHISSISSIITLISAVWDLVYCFHMLVLSSCNFIKLMMLFLRVIGDVTYMVCFSMVMFFSNNTISMPNIYWTYFFNSRRVWLTKISGNTINTALSTFFNNFNATNGVITFVLPSPIFIWWTPVTTFFSNSSTISIIFFRWWGRKSG